jgi:U3 small nucleolar RNA-associated protein 12
MVKVWNFRSMQCIRTIPSGYGLCGVFVPGNRHIIIGTKEGHLELYGLSSSSCLQSVVAHSGPVWSIAIRYAHSLVQDPLVQSSSSRIPSS